jgi:hypothetical protein
MEKHRTSYKAWKEGKYGKIYSFELFEKYGVENCRILLLETCPCNTRDELHSREGFHIRNLACVNKVIPTRTARERYETNKDTILAKQNAYDALHRNEIAVRSKKYADCHKEELAKYNKERYENNKIKFQEKLICECGSTCSRGSMTEHKKTKKHKNYENSLIQT